MRIHQLPSDVVTKIAAGEVIERPASVVKELLENSIDAGARDITLEVEQGGADLIRVVDDGHGIHPDDLPLAFASHATSKLGNADDLFRIGTLGFRGEALASIGGVAQVHLQSRVVGQSSGAELTCHGGQLSPVRPWNGAPGTRIEVHHLFYNTPVRRRFLRTPVTEIGHVCETFTRLALAKPSLRLTLRHNDKEVYEVHPTADLRERIGLFFGAEVRDQLYSIDVVDGPIKLHGHVADPACDRGNAKLQYLFINGRWVRDRSLAHALQEGYRGLLMTGRYPVSFLFLELPPDLVDVNVHPTKVEVRFRDGSRLYQLVLSSIRRRLLEANLVPRLRPPVYASGPLPWQTSSQPAGAPHFPFPQVSIPDASQSLLRTAAIPSQLPPLASLPERGTYASETPASSANTTGAHQFSTGAKAIQLYDAYLVLETPEGMLVIDQHALHERILFEHLKSKFRDGQLETQRLLIPEPIDLPAEQSARVLENQTALAALGLGVQEFGGGTLLLTSYPAFLGNRPPQEIFRRVVDHLASKDRLPNRDQLFSDLLSVMACHAAVRSGDRLTPDEIASLIEQRDVADNTHHCPHGRPTSLLFTRQELDRQFRRI